MTIVAAVAVLPIPGGTASTVGVLSFFLLLMKGLRGQTSVLNMSLTLRMTDDSDTTTF